MKSITIMLVSALLANPLGASLAPSVAAPFPARLSSVLEENALSSRALPYWGELRPRSLLAATARKLSVPRPSLWDHFRNPFEWENREMQTVGGVGFSFPAGKLVWQGGLQASALNPPGSGWGREKKIVRRAPIEGLTLRFSRKFYETIRALHENDREEVERLSSQYYNVFTGIGTHQPHAGRLPGKSLTYLLSGLSELRWGWYRPVFRYDPRQRSLTLLHHYNKRQSDARLEEFNEEVYSARQQILDARNPEDRPALEWLDQWLYGAPLPALHDIHDLRELSRQFYGVLFNSIKDGEKLNSLHHAVSLIQLGKKSLSKEDLALFEKGFSEIKPLLDEDDTTVSLNAQRWTQNADPDAMLSAKNLLFEWAHAQSVLLRFIEKELLADDPDFESIDYVYESLANPAFQAEIQVRLDRREQRLRGDAVMEDVGEQPSEPHARPAGSNGIHTFPSRNGSPAATPLTATPVLKMPTPRRVDPSETRREFLGRVARKYFGWMVASMVVPGIVGIVRAWLDFRHDEEMAAQNVLAPLAFRPTKPDPRLADLQLISLTVGENIEGYLSQIKNELGLLHQDLTHRIELMLRPDYPAWKEHLSFSQDTLIATVHLLFDRPLHVYGPPSLTHKPGHFVASAAIIDNPALTERLLVNPSSTIVSNHLLLNGGFIGRLAGYAREHVLESRKVEKAGDSRSALLLRAEGVRARMLLRSAVFEQMVIALAVAENPLRFVYIEMLENRLNDIRSASGSQEERVDLLGRLLAHVVDVYARAARMNVYYLRAAGITATDIHRIRQRISDSDDIWDRLEALMDLPEDISLRQAREVVVRFLLPSVRPPKNRSNFEVTLLESGLEMLRKRGVVVRGEKGRFLPNPTAPKALEKFLTTPDRLTVPLHPSPASRPLQTAA